MRECICERKRYCIVLYSVHQTQELESLRGGVYESVCVRERQRYCTVCPGSSDPFYIVTYYIKVVTTSCAYSRDEAEKILGLTGTKIRLLSA